MPIDRRTVFAGSGLIVVAVVAAGVLWHEYGALSPRADADNPRLVALGKSVYHDHCASCHGANLEGQPNWKERLPTGRLPAPPHDATGHTWHHSDRLLFDITMNGTAAVVGAGYESDMRGFGPILSDDEIRAVLAFIKSSWPE